ncbi:MAG: hypothetical protein HY020_10750 [Burkholderiales bacterium]|nr:hypothetical protein [Burkholderiales bacterium]
MSHSLRAALRCLLLALSMLAQPAGAAPFRPRSDAQVLATVPARASDPHARELAELRAAWRAAPQDVGRATALARRYFEQVAAEGDPRYIGYAESALQPWWALPDQPPDVRVLRAMLLQFDHRFEPALADLAAALQARPDDGVAWSWQTAILMVRADYDAARRSCEGLVQRATPLVAAACRAQVDAVTGRAEQAATALHAALQKAVGAGSEERLWVLTRLAETEERLGQFAAAEKAFNEAIKLDVADVYLQAAFADFLLDRGRAAEVLKLLADGRRADVLLLRLALAAKAAREPQAPVLAAELAARFDAARQRGDTTHRKEESRFVLALQGDVPRALALAQQNWREQREPADARILLEAALAARDRAAAQPVLDWMKAWNVQSVALHSLASQLRALP